MILPAKAATPRRANSSTAAAALCGSAAVSRTTSSSGLPTIPPASLTSRTASSSPASKCWPASTQPGRVSGTRAPIWTDDPSVRSAPGGDGGVFMRWRLPCDDSVAVCPYRRVATASVLVRSLRQLSRVSTTASDQRKLVHIRGRNPAPQCAWRVDVQGSGLLSLRVVDRPHAHEGRIPLVRDSGRLGQMLTDVGSLERFRVLLLTGHCA